MTSSLRKEISRRRTFAIISHPDAGKTTLTEKLLLFGGAIQMAGTVKARKSQRHATSDWMEVEKQRGISVASSVMQFEHDGHIINLLDTPGHEDFSEDTYRVLTAVDAALMVIDAAKGVETQTIKLLEVCRLRNTPIITFINKLDREVREPLELLDEIESVLGIECAPITWPVGMGKTFRGVYHLQTDRMLRFAAGEDTAKGDVEVIAGLNNAELARQYPVETEQLRNEVELLRGAATEFDHAAFRGGRQTPVFFGSAINNFGVREILRALIDWAPEPQPRNGGSREVIPDEEAFSGFVFKIQANMDPMHRDRIAFFRVCSGRFTPGLKARHQRLGREIKIPSAITFLAAGRAHREDAAPGDIIGIHNHGQFQIGDTLTQGEPLSFKGIPYFAPELFRRAHLKDPLRSKQLHRGLKELGEEGAIQVFEPRQGAGLILGAVGALQFDIVAARLQAEYKVDAVFEPVRIHAARWVTSTNRRKLADFCEANALRTATDVDGNLVFLADSRANLELTQERWPDLQFHEIREHGERL